METKYLKINPDDNVIVAITDLKAGEIITVDNITIHLNEDVPAGHKVALKDFTEGENIIKYGYPIGHTLTALKQGDWINEKNIKTNLAGLLEYTYNPIPVSLDIPKKDLTFKGYRRKNGDVGVRNEIWIIPTVGCVNGIANQLADALRIAKTLMQSSHLHTITVARNWEMIMKTPKRFSVIWYFTQMQELYWW